jgi:hypothetical protein
MSPGSHVGFPISAKNKNLVYDHPMNISAKFGSNLFCGLRFLFLALIGNPTWLPGLIMCSDWSKFKKSSC